MKRTLEQYKDISADVWMIFKKYFPTDADLDDFVADIHKLDKKYEMDEQQYRFMQRILKVYFDELNDIKGAIDAGVGKD